MLAVTHRHVATLSRSSKRQRVTASVASRPAAAGGFQPAVVNLKEAAKPKPAERPAKQVHSFFYFDPDNPDQVVEVKASGAENKDEIAAAFTGSSLALAPSDRPTAKEVMATEAALNKSTAMQQELLMQLEVERQKVKELQQYDSLSKEWRVRAQTASAELSMLQRALAEKDAELATAYKRLEMAAEERAALRKLSITLEEEASCLQAIAEETKLIQGNVVPMAPRTPAATAAAAAASNGASAKK